MNDKEKAAAGYILSYYEQIQHLTREYSLYLNLLAELKISEGTLDKLEEIDRDKIKIAVQQVRYFCHVTYIQYRAITQKIGIKEDKKITEIYDKIKDEYIINRKYLELFVKEMHLTLVNEVLSELMEKSQDFVKQIYHDDRSNTDQGHDISQGFSQ